jgi:hypothetical protein
MKHPTKNETPLYFISIRRWIFLELDTLYKSQEL